MFRNEDMVTLANSVASKKQKRARQSSSTEAQEATDSATSQEVAEPSQVVDDQVLQQLAELDAVFMDGSANFQPLRPDTLGYWQEKSHLVVLSLFSARQDDYRIFGLASFLPHMLFEAENGSYIRLCCQALTLALLANKTMTLEAFQIRDEAYGKALNAIHAAIADTGTRQEDATAISVWLLGVYEVIRVQNDASIALTHATACINLTDSSIEAQNPDVEDSRGWFDATAKS